MSPERGCDQTDSTQSHPKSKRHHHLGAPADIIVNASGFLASRLGGLDDDAVYPIRGHIVLVRNEVSLMTTISGTEDADDVRYAASCRWRYDFKRDI